MKPYLIALAFLSSLSLPAYASVQRCIGMTPDSARLACFDSEVKLTPVRISSASAKRGADCPVAEQPAQQVPVYIQVQPGTQVLPAPGQVVQPPVMHRK